MATGTASGNYFQIAKSYNGASRFTVACWVYPNASGVAWFAGMWETGALQWLIAKTSTNNFSINIFDTWYATYDFPSGAYWTLIPTGAWTHVAMVYDPSDATTQLRAFVNGYDSGGRTVNNKPVGSLNNVSGSFGIGGSQAGGSPFDGRIAEFATWTQALTAAQINSLYKGFSPKKISRPDCYIPFVRNAQDETNKYAITTVGSPSIQNHPRIYL